MTSELETAPQPVASPRTVAALDSTAATAPAWFPASLAGKLSSLDPLETSEQSGDGITLTGYDVPRTEFRSQPADRLESLFRHSGWRFLRQKVWSAMLRTRQSNGRLERFAECGAGLIVQRHKSDGRHRICGTYCHDRLCLPCGTARASKLARALADRIKGRRVRFVTLTLRHSPTPLTDQLDRLYSSFKLLRRRRGFGGCFKAGAAFLEIKRSRCGTMWHPHLHILTEGDFVSQRELSRAWHSITGDSFIVDIQFLRNSEEVVSYVTKYASKPMDASFLNSPDAADEFVTAIKGRRLTFTFGLWRKLDADSPDDAPDQWESLGTVITLSRRAAQGDDDARLALEAALRGRSFPTGSHLHPDG